EGRIAHGGGTENPRIRGGAVEVRIVQVGPHRLEAFGGGIELVGAVGPDHVGTRPRLVEVNVGGGARIRIAGKPDVRDAGMDVRLDLVDVGIEVRQVGVGSAAGGKRLVALVLHHHDVPALRGDVVAQVP